MAFDWDDYLTYAKTLVNSEDEAEVRACVSRAYYAAHWKARLKAGMSDAPNIHAKVKEYYETSRSPQVKLDNDIGARLAQLYDLRIAADYKSEVEITKFDASRACHIAQKVMEKIAKKR